MIDELKFCVGKIKDLSEEVRNLREIISECRSVMSNLHYDWEDMEMRLGPEKVTLLDPERVYVNGKYVWASELSSEEEEEEEEKGGEEGEEVKMEEEVKIEEDKKEK